MTTATAATSTATKERSTLATVGKNLRELTVLPGLIILIVIGSVVSPIFLTSSNASLVLQQSSELGVVAINKGVFEYVAKEKIIRIVGEKLKKDKQIENLSDWVRTSEGNEAYTEFRAELEAAKEKSLSNK